MLIYENMGGVQRMELQRAILLYSNNSALQEHTLATLHEIIKPEPNGPEPDPAAIEPVIGPGRPFTREMLDALIREMAGPNNQQRQFMPETMLCYDGTLMAWWCPARRCPIYFSTADHGFNKAVHGKTVLHPPLLFKARPGSLHVYALHQNQRPQKNSPVFIAPYCNLYSDGHMCRGTVRLPTVLSPNELPIWETAFFETSFTHSNLGKQMTAYPGGHNALWRHQVKSRAKSFPVQYLIPYTAEQKTHNKKMKQKMTVIEVINQ